MPKWCHYGAMNLTGYVEALRQQLAVAAAAGGDEAQALAERLTAPLDAATRLVLLDALSAAAGRSPGTWRRARSTCGCGTGSRRSW